MIWNPTAMTVPANRLVRSYKLLPVPPKIWWIALLADRKPAPSFSAPVSLTKPLVPVRSMLVTLAKSAALLPLAVVAHKVVFVPATTALLSATVRNLAVGEPSPPNAMLLVPPKEVSELTTHVWKPLVDDPAAIP